MGWETCWIVETNADRILVVYWKLEKELEVRFYNHVQENVQ